jgi:transcriptional regulator with XRE-family HTH domain
MQAVYLQIGQKIAYYRKLRNFSQDELARRVNISKSSLGKIERGKYNNNIPMSVLIAIAESLNIELATLVTFNAEEKKMQWEMKVGNIH